MRGQHTESRGMSRTLPAKKGGRGSGSRRPSGVAGICPDGRTDGRQCDLGVWECVMGQQWDMSLKGLDCHAKKTGSR